MHHVAALDAGQLRAWGADEIEHPGGTLLAHLERTAGLLREWNASAPLVAAGLYHATYGTDGFPRALVPLERRQQLRDLIGEEAEAQVYLYACCDRAFTYPRIGRDSPVAFRDRFTGAVFTPDDAALRDFVELTFANELDLVAQNEAFAQAVGPELSSLFRQWRGYASDPALKTLARRLPG